MTITRVADSSNNVDDTNSMSLSVPTGTVDGDLILFFGSCDGIGFSLITGFTQIFDIALDDTHQLRLDFRVASSEPGSHTVNTKAAINEKGIGIFVTIRGQKATDFLDQMISSTENVVISISIPEILPSEAKEMILAFIGSNDGMSANPFMSTNTTSLTEQLDNVNGPTGSGGGSAAGGYLDEIQTDSIAVSGGVDLLNAPTDAGVLMVSIKEEPLLDLTDVTYSKRFFDATPQIPSGNASSVIFNPDGTKMYVLDFLARFGFEYDLALPFDLGVGNVTYSGNSANFSVQAGEATAFRFNNDGTKIFVMGFSGDRIYEYDVNTTPFSFGSVTFSGQSVLINDQGETTATAFNFNEDGTKIFVVGVFQDIVREYDMGTAFDLSGTFTYSGDSFSVGSVESVPEGMAFTSRGFRMFIVGTNTNAVHQFNVSPLFSLGVAGANVTNPSISFDISNETTNARGVTFSPDNKKMFIIDSANKIYEYFVGDIPGIGEGNAFDRAFSEAFTRPFTKAFR